MHNTLARYIVDSGPWGEAVRCAGATMMVSVAPFVKSRASMFLGPSLTFMVVYVWARRNQFVRLSLFGLFTFTAPYLPWVLVGLDMLLGASPVKDLLGIFAGHIYYFFEDVYPRMNNGFKLLATPSLLVSLFGETPSPPAETVPPDQPAGGGDPIVEQAPAHMQHGNHEDRPGQDAPQEQHAHAD
jgi:Derlin-2/3